MPRMSRLRRMVLSGRFFFISCRVLPTRGILSETEFSILASVINERRAERGCRKEIIKGKLK